MRTLSLVLTTSLLLMGGVLAGCGGSGSDSAGGDASDASATATASGSASGSGSGAADRTVTIEPKGNQMKYKQTEFTVAPGATIKLVFDNSATAPSMQHNVVVLNKAPSDEVFRRVGEGGMQAGSANEYVPDDSAVLAATDMSQPGETVSVTFTAPEETGDYGYLCTFPGHWATMQGTMHVKE
jgi:azurin